MSSQEDQPDGEADPVFKCYDMWVECERDLLSWLLNNPDVYDTLDCSLDEMDFFLAEHREIYSIIAFFLDELLDISVQAIGDELKQSGKLASCGGWAYLNALKDRKRGPLLPEELCALLVSRSVIKDLFLKM